MDSNGIFASRYTPSDPKFIILDPQNIKFLGFRGLVGIEGDFRETIPACFNFAAAHIFSLYPKKLSYSSRNAYIKKIRVRELRKPTCLLTNLKKRLQTYEFFL